MAGQGGQGNARRAGRSAIVLAGAMLVAAGLSACSDGGRSSTTTGPDTTTHHDTTTTTTTGIWARLAAGTTFTCGLTTHGIAYCWGQNRFGQLGDASTDSASGFQRLKPVAVAGGLTFTTLVAGTSHACGLTASGAAYCWGANGSGQLGDGSTAAQRLSPTPVAGGLSFASLTAGDVYTCGLTAAGGAYCWGDDDRGQLGDAASITGGDIHRPQPTQVFGGHIFANVTAGRRHTCGVTTAGAAYCWGDNSYGQLGDSTQFVRTEPRPVVGGLTFGSVSAGYQHNCGMTRGGAAYCWGEEYPGGFGAGAAPLCFPDQPGDGNEPCLMAPAALAGTIAFVSLTPGRGFTCALRSNGAAYCWGYNVTGQLGNGTMDASTNYQAATPTAVGGGLTFTSLTAGRQHACGVTNTARAYCWGDNSTGQLGDNSTSNRSSPVQVLSP
jgi:alpha-tubulin suppressor-like RCC1 family protein